MLHSSGLRRLGDKTQVLSPGFDDFVRTRLTHSLEVAQIGRELARSIGCDPDIVDTACLAHDLGHPPFGHNGETALSDLAVDIGGFEGNAQTLRLLTRLEPKIVRADGTSAGLNLTRATLDAVAKYPWPVEQAPAPSGQSSRIQKFGVYADDMPVFTWLRENAPERTRCLEAQLMDLADDISYSVHDVEDAVMAGALKLGELTDEENVDKLIKTTRAWYLPGTDEIELVEALNRLQSLDFWPAGLDGSRRSQAALKNMASQLIGRFCLAAEVATRAVHGRAPLCRYDADLVVPHDTVTEISVLKGLATISVMVNERRQSIQSTQRDVIVALVDYAYDNPGSLDPAFRGDHEQAADDGGRLRAVIDQVASLTDNSAWNWYRDITGKPGPHDDAGHVGVTE
ncbi:deoxyguanosinetriphosphate triphosphohydrolase [Spelaeicoccus albus]|uniref:dGTPase n=1 Tax=Spelaeicoccus albus TaxID=1280376 RepID=A0A7Z0II48_9MICO|nr:dGTPase [Spelaeicoccus albus]